MPEIKERPILFSAPMVRAILEGRKTVTRRPLKPLAVELIEYHAGIPTEDSQAEVDFQYATYFDDERKEIGPEWLCSSSDYPEEGVVPFGQCPYGKPGDRLWVRETFIDLRGTGVEHRPDPDGPLQRYAYAADCRPGSHSDGARKDFGLKYKPSIHMPRAACRILLEISHVRVERLQDISEDQAEAEGVRLMRDGSDTWVSREGPGNLVTPWPTAKEAFSDLWNSINGPHAWAANPWVWAVSFKRVTP
ncbi:hypothetical protein IMF22_05130 [Pseudomonas poae]|uniref:Morphogenetic protein n=1 Tax=Pseudomonas poae TaxID=200451 RepID=A0A7M1KK12_9PSED|nr:hypothetical protein [Pseudomonas poae]QOQ76444.1 hypothetical protein IMF22_05130 [Pseudomonas poae]